MYNFFYFSYVLNLKLSEIKYFMKNKIKFKIFNINFKLKK